MEIYCNAFHTAPFMVLVVPYNYQGNSAWVICIHGHTPFHYRDKSVLVGNDIIDMNFTSALFSTFTLLFVPKCSCLYNKTKITRRLEDMNFIFWWLKTIFYSLAVLVCIILFLPLEKKFVSLCHRVISSMYTTFIFRA